MRVTNFGHTLPRLNSDGPYKGFPAYTDLAVASGASLAEVRDREIRKLTVMQAAIERRLKKLRALPDHSLAS